MAFSRCDTPFSDITRQCGSWYPRHGLHGRNSYGVLDTLPPYLTRVDPQLFQSRSNFYSRSSILFVWFSQINDDSFICACCGETKRAKKRRCSNLPIQGIHIPSQRAVPAACMRKLFGCFETSHTNVALGFPRGPSVHARNLQREAPSPNPGKPDDDYISSCPAAAGFLLCLHLNLTTVMIFHYHATNITS